MAQPGSVTLLGVVVACCCAWHAAAAAQQDAVAQGATRAQNEGVAKGLFQAGKAAYEGGRYEEALEFFEQAYAQSLRPRMFYNIGQAADRSRRDERALEAFRKFLELVPDDPLCEQVRLRVAALERGMAERGETRGGETRDAESPEPASSPVSPSEVASAASPPAAGAAFDPALDSYPERDRGEGGLLGEWWFWAGVGVVAVGGAAALVLVLGDEPAAGAKPITGEVGGVVQTLGRF